MRLGCDWVAPLVLLCLHRHTSLPSPPPQESAAAADALVTACHDGTDIHGSEEAVTAGAARIMGHHACQRQKTLVFCADADKAGHTTAPHRWERQALQAASWRAARHWGTLMPLRSLSDTAVIAPASKLKNSSGCRWTLNGRGAYCTMASSTGRRISCITLSGCSLNTLWATSRMHYCKGCVT